MTALADTEESLHKLYQEYLNRMTDHGCYDVALPFTEWIALD